jgi:hypothetical protein
VLPVHVDAIRESQLLLDIDSLSHHMGSSKTKIVNGNFNESFA